MKQNLLILLFCFSTLTSAFAQNRIVTGRVTASDNGQPIAGVTVIVKGTNTGAQTNADGRYSIQAATGSSLVFSYIGFITQTVAAKGTVNVTLSPATNALNEIVVVGYGTQLKKDVTGSLSSIKGAEFTDRAIPSFDKDLAGKATGVQVTNPSGILGQPTQIRIRGTNSINNGASPLFVVDGIPVPVNNTGDVGGFTASNPLADINPNDIESFEILKDGAATAIYGSRAANGVILINTKKGKSGVTTFNYDAYYATAKVSKKYDLLNANQFIEVANERLVNAGNPAQAFQTPDGNGGFVNTNWLDYIFKRASQQNHSISASGGNDKGKYFFSLGYSDQKGVVISNALKRYTFRANLDQKVNKFISVGINAGVTYQDNTGPTVSGNAISGDIYGGIRMLPNVTIFNPADPTGYNISADRKSLGLGANLTPISDNTPNQVFILEKNKNRSQTYRLLGNAFMQLNLAPGLTFKTVFGIDDQFIDDFQFRDPRHGDGFAANGLLQQAYTPSTSWDWQNILNYTKTIADDHHLDVTLVNEYQKTRLSFFLATGSNLSDVFFNQNITTNTFVTPTASGGLTYRSIDSYVGRINYNYKNRYYISGSLRSDELSNLPASTRKGYFPGGAVAYRISEEPFFSEIKALSFISDLRIRGSYANVGNVDIGSFPYLGTYGAAAYAGQSGIGYNQTGNPQLKWERQSKYDGGLDIGLFGGRASIVAAYYLQDSKDLILAAPTPPSLGIPSNTINRNIGAVRNSGIELALSGDVLRTKDVRWTSTLNFSTQHNKVLALVDGQDSFFTIGSGTYNVRRVGEPLNALFGYQYSGVNPANGNPLYTKSNGQVIQGNVSTSAYFNYDPANPTALTTAATLASTDRKVLGNILPTYYGGFNNTVTYKNLDLNVFLRFSGGNKIYNRARVDELNQNFVNNGTEILGRWQSVAVPGDGVTPKQYFGNSTFINLDTQASTRFVEDGSYVRLDNVTLGYTLPADIVSKLKISRLRLYISGQNLFVITKYRGLDPETSTTGTVNTVNSPNIAATGVDYNGNPQQRTFTFGLNLGF
ncbi:MAG: TonB-dependent receptor [Mucilaginibacter sp.]|uniref:SusC/RagA family TonB-linked outer membrane protein n=1 Tax=Mucilaginibacter sp. TaxID=1882438 RepID=UPI00262D84D6|nr:TonB-dependent receptor [Mucilaginibacter sp.]MDB5004916.1 TonB-dependent receptor [Mucilaginibacter sp.]